MVDQSEENQKPVHVNGRQETPHETVPSTSQATGTVNGEDAVLNYDKEEETELQHSTATDDVLVAESAAPVPATQASRNTAQAEIPPTPTTPDDQPSSRVKKKSVRVSLPALLFGGDILGKPDTEERGSTLGQFDDISKPRSPEATSFSEIMQDFLRRASSKSTFIANELSAKADERRRSSVASSVLKQRRRSCLRRDREVGLVRALLVVVVMTSASIVPYLITTVLIPVIPIPAEVVMACILFLYINNSFSWVVYVFMIASVRKRYVENVRMLLKFSRCSAGPPSRRVSESQIRTSV